MKNLFLETDTNENQILSGIYEYSTYSLKDAMGDNGDWED